MSDPHVSPALKHLRFGVSAAAGLLAITLIAHLLLFGLIHYTDIRVTQLEGSPTANGEEPVIVVHKPRNAGASAEQAAKPADAASAASAAPATAESKAAPKSLTKLPAHERTIDSLPQGHGIDANLVPSPAARQLRTASAVMQTLGVCSALALMILMFQGVCIAAGSNVPGVDKAVTASSWTLLLVFLALPWRGVMPEMLYPGVFQSFESIAHQSDILRGDEPGKVSTFTFYTMNLVLPLLMLGGTAAVALRFRIGVERGIIVTHASQLEEQIEREIRERKLGELSTPRAVGALNRAIGLGAGAVEPAPEIVTPRAHEAAVSPMSARSPAEAPRRAI